MMNRSADVLSSIITLVAEKTANEPKEKIGIWHQAKVPTELKK